MKTHPASDINLLHLFIAIDMIPCGGKKTSLPAKVTTPDYSGPNSDSDTVHPAAPNNSNAWER
jgi:hypothetical protein